MASPIAARGEGTPAFKAPALACDAHFHVFGPAGRCPYGSDLRYAPPEAARRRILVENPQRLFAF